MLKFVNPFNWYRWGKAGFQSAWSAVSKFGPKYKLLPSGAAKGGFTTAQKTIAGGVYDGLVVTVGTVVISALAIFGFKKTDDATKTAGFLALVAGLTGIAVGALIMLRRR